MKAIEGMVPAMRSDGTPIACIWPPMPCKSCGRLAAFVLCRRDGHWVCVDCDPVRLPWQEQALLE
jgi:hypothetical protein